jgi:hypothetical protein
MNRASLAARAHPFISREAIGFGGFGSQSRAFI